MIDNLFHVKYSTYIRKKSYSFRRSSLFLMYHVSQHTNHQAIECRKIVSIRGGFIILVVFAGSSSKKFTSSKKTTLKINRFLIESEDWQKSAKNSQSTKIWSNKFKWFYGITVTILSLNIQISLLDVVAWQWYFVVISLDLDFKLVQL